MIRSLDVDAAIYNIKGGIGLFERFFTRITFYICILRDILSICILILLGFEILVLRSFLILRNSCNIDLITYLLLRLKPYHRTIN